jgi:hypothetical protein
VTWTKTSDDFPEAHLDLSDAAYRLHHAATTFSNRLLLDGRIPRTHLTLVAVPPKTRRPAIVRELVAADLWAEDGDAWTLTDFHLAQPTKEEVLAEREYAAVRQRIRYAKSAVVKAELRRVEDTARERLNAAREHRRALISQCESQSYSQPDSQRPVPTRPVPTRPYEVEDEDDGAPSGIGPVEAEPPVALTEEQRRRLRSLPADASLKEKVAVLEGGGR